MIRSTTDKPIVIASRGASGYHQENSMAAFDSAIKMDSDMIHCDVMVPADEKPITMASKHFITDAMRQEASESNEPAILAKLLRKRINNIKMAEVEKVARRNALSPASLSDVLNACVGSTDIIIEISQNDVAEKVLDLALSILPPQAVAIMARDETILGECRSLCPEIMTIFSFQSTCYKRVIKECPSDIDAYATTASYLKPAIVDQLAKVSKGLFAWGVHTKEDMISILERQMVNGILTSKPNLGIHLTR